MSLKYLDAHCHLQFSWFDQDREVIIEKMKGEGIGGIVVGCDYESSKKAVELAEKYEHFWASIGLHPNDEPGEWFEADAYRALAKSAKVVAIGECGLDYFRNDATPAEKQRQKKVLHDHLALAAELDKPLIIHSRPSKGTQDAYQDLIAILKEAKEKWPSLRGDIHFFVGGIEELHEFTALGFTLSFTAVPTFARDYDAVIRAAPLSSILSETDSPFVAPASRRGQRNDPLSIPEIVSKLAEIRSEEPEAFQAALFKNAQMLFRLAA